MAGGVLFIGMGVLIVAGPLLVLLGPGLQVLDPIVWAMLALTAAFPVLLGAFPLWHALRAPRAVGSTLDAVHFELRTVTASVPYGALAYVETARSLFRGPFLRLGLSDASVYELPGLPPLQLEGVVAQVEKRAPQVVFNSRWAAMLLPDGRLLSDARMVDGLAARLQARRGVWVTPTEVLASKTGAMRGAFPVVFLLFPFVIVLQLLPRGALSAGIILGLLGVMFLGLAVVLVRGYFRYAPGKFGSSTLALDRAAVPFDELKERLAPALRSFGLTGRAKAPRMLLGTRREVWKGTSGVRVKLGDFPIAGRVSLSVETVGVENAAAHRRLKGLVLEAAGLAPLPPGVTASVTAGAAPARPSASLSPWGKAVLSDGRELADAPFSMGAMTALGPLGAADGAVAWMSRGTDADRRLLLVLLPVFAFVFFILGVFMGALLGLDFEVAVAVGATVSALTTGALLYYAVPLMRGQAANAILNLPGAFSAEGAAASAVDRAVGRLGVRLFAQRSGPIGRVWKLEGPLRVRHTAATEFYPARLYVSARGARTQDSYARLKGQLLEELGITPGGPLRPQAPPPPVGSPLPAAAPPAPTFPLQRGPRPSGTVDAPPPWAYSEALGAGPLTPDVGVPPAGVESLTPGWWGASPRPLRSSRAERFGQLFAFLLLFGVVGSLALSQALRGRTPTSLPVLAGTYGFLGAIMGSALVAAWWSSRRRRRQARNHEIHSFLCVDAPGVPIETLAIATAQAAAWARPTLWPAPPPPGAAAAWKENTGELGLVLFAPPGRLPYLELTGTSEGALAPRLKGAIEATFYGPRVAAAPGVSPPEAARPLPRRNPL